MGSKKKTEKPAAPGLGKRIDALESRLGEVEQRLGIDHVAIEADRAAALVRGAEAAPLSEPAAVEEEAA